MTSLSRDLLECVYCVLLWSYGKSKSNIPYFYFLVYVWVTCKCGLIKTIEVAS